ncbi:MAG: cytochrome c nitrite reductase small subunit [Ignavibacteriae bacterium]|nr:cytochrome c nitrite reductase small subunit [Ignavibacteriota bacterium]
MHPSLVDRSRAVLRALLPPPQWKLPVILSLGVLCGIGLFVLHTSNATSYLSSDPVTCVNCHVMSPQYATWQHSSHGRFATCVDCHVPHDNVFRTYAFKAQDGMRHAYVFTFRLEPQVIQIREAGKTVVQENCIRCHEHLLDRVAVGTVTFDGSRHGQGLLCWSCHRETPHGTVNSLASAPYARVPRLSPVVPPWLVGGAGQERK